MDRGDTSQWSSPWVSIAWEASHLIYLVHLIESTLVGRAEAPGHRSVSCKVIERLESYKFRETQWMFELNVSFEIIPAFEVCLV